MEVRKMKRFTKGFAILLAVALVSGIAWAHDAPATAPSTQGQVAPMPDNSGNFVTPPTQVQPFNQAPQVQGQPFNWGPYMQGKQFNQTPLAQGQGLDVPYTGPDGYYCNHRWGRFAPGHRTRCYDSWYSNVRPNGYYGYRDGHGGGCGNSCW